MDARGGGRASRWSGLQGRRLGAITLILVVVVASVLGLAGRTAQPAGPVAWRGPRPGGTWTVTSLRIQTNALLADPDHPSVLYAGTDDGVWRSLDQGTRWTPTGLRERVVTALAMDAGSRDLYAGDQDGIVFAGRNPTAGTTWQAASPVLGGTPVFSLAVSQALQVVLAGSTGALYRGVQGAQGWQWQRVARTDDASISSIVWFPANGHDLAIASVFGVSPAVIASDDGGRTWHASVDGLPATLPTQALLALATQPPAVILTTMGGGVWERAASGSWHDISRGLPEQHAMPVVALAGQGPPVLYAGTMGYGIYVKQGSAAWAQLGRGLTGAENTVLAIARRRRSGRVHARPACRDTIRRLSLHGDHVEGLCRGSSFRRYPKRRVRTSNPGAESSRRSGSGNSPWRRQNTRGPVVRPVPWCALACRLCRSPGDLRQSRWATRPCVRAWMPGTPARRRRTGRLQGTWWRS